MSNIVVTDWEEVEVDDFYLSDEWISEIGSKEKQKELKEMAENNEIFEAFLVDCCNYAVFQQMDSQKVFIDSSRNILLHCESTVIDNDHEEKWKDDE